MLQYYIWRARYILTALAGLAALAIITLLIIWIIAAVGGNGAVEAPAGTPPMFIVERTYTKESGYSCIYSDGKYLYDNDLQRLPRLSPSDIYRVEIDINTQLTGDYETYAGSRTINPLSIKAAGFQYDIPYNFYGTQQDISMYIALMLGAGFEVESLCEVKDSAILELSLSDERVRIVVGRNRLRVYSKMIGIDEFE